MERAEFIDSNVGLSRNLCWPNWKKIKNTCIWTQASRISDKSTLATNLLDSNTDLLHEENDFRKRIALEEIEIIKTGTTGLNIVHKNTHTSKLANILYNTP